MHVRHSRALSVLVAGLLLAGLLGGCDSTDLGGSEPVVLFTTVDDFRFTFDADELETGRFRDLFSGDVDLGPFLRSQGFTKAELLGAQIESARLEVLFPVSETAAFINSAILKLDAPGISSREVANQTSFPADDDEVELNVLPGRDVADFIERDAFSAILQLDPRTLEAGDQYELVVVLRFRLELEGV